ncbi:MAG: glucose-6-phosphate isomerase, partial [Sphingomonas sp.]|nr:glucose-6-phosphate isomerase [Sphingomonas sp.]
MSAGDWKAIEDHQLRPLVSLFEAEPDRLSRLAHEVAGLYFDWTKTHLDSGLVDAFVALADEAQLESARDALFSGGIVNPTEGRAAEHVAERGQGDPDAVALAVSRRT